MARLFNNILETVGQTPVVKLSKLAPEHVNLYVKVESFNPMGSIKDRLALGVIEDAEKRGELKTGQTVVEATSGNTGIGLAMVCAQKGYPLVVVMAENFSVERRKILRFFGARVILTPAHLKGSGMLAKAQELADKHGWWLPRQFDNQANAEIHAKTTAREILSDFAKNSLNYWVTGFGTGGTLNGVAGVLKQHSPKTKVVVCEPDNAQMLASGITQPKDNDSKPVASHPKFRPHLMQGWSPDFISSLTEQVSKKHLIDQFVAVSGLESLKMAQRLAQLEGIFVGTSSGATLKGAIQVAQSAPEGSNILCMLPDTGERYLSTPLFANIAEDMTEKEIEISRSTENYRFDKPTAVPTVAEQIKSEPEIQQQVDAIINDGEKQITMFSMEWCEFCWSGKKMLNHCGIEYCNVDIDSVEYQENDRGSKIRAALTQQTGCNTIPQIFIAGKFIGGCTDLFDMWLDGSLQRMLNENKIHFRKKENLNPYQFLPNWLHPR